MTKIILHVFFGDTAYFHYFVRKHEAYNDKTATLTYGDAVVIDVDVLVVLAHQETVIEDTSYARVVCNKPHFCHVRISCAD